MSLKRYSLAALALFATAPFTTQAAAPGAAVAFDACVKAFVDTYLPNRAVRQQKTLEFAHTPLAFWQPRNFTIALRAHGAESGELFAEARCIADRNGIVLVLDSPPAKDFLARADVVATLR